MFLNEPIIRSQCKIIMYQTRRKRILKLPLYNVIPPTNIQNKDTHAKEEGRGCGGVRMNLIFGFVYSSSTDRNRITRRYPACLQNASTSSLEISPSSRPSVRNASRTRVTTCSRSALNLRR